ncbi:MAG: hypothetical protein GXP35_03645 [Actinobacteria bacterium]|nr:hypothetical protein [Actinomycetota bacterium]
MRVALGVVVLVAAVAVTVFAASQLSGAQNDPAVENSNTVAYGSATLEALLEAIPLAVASLAHEPTALSSVRLPPETAEALAEAARSGLSEVGPVYDGDGVLVGHTFAIEVPPDTRLTVIRPSPYTEEFQSLVPASAEEQTVRLDGVAQMLVSVSADGSIQTLEHHPVGLGGERVSVTIVSPVLEQVEIVTDAEGNPVLTGDGKVRLRVGDRVIEVAPGSVNG